MLSISIEGYNNVIPDVGAQFNDCLDEGIANGTFVWHTYDYPNPIKPFTKCTVNLDGEASYWLASSKVEIPITAPRRQYKHIVNLIDPIYALQGVTMPNRAFTQPLQAELNFLQQTYWDVLNNVQQTVPLDVESNIANSRVFRLDPNLRNIGIFGERTRYKIKIYRISLGSSVNTQTYTIPNKRPATVTFKPSGSLGATSPIDMFFHVYSSYNETTKVTTYEYFLSVSPTDTSQGTGETPPAEIELDSFDPNSSVTVTLRSELGALTWIYPVNMNWSSFVDSFTYPTGGSLFPANFPTSKNLYEFVCNIGRSIGAVPKMLEWDILTYVFLDDTENAITDEEWITHAESADTQDYCSQLEADAMNILDEDSALVYPYPNGWISVRTDGSDSVIKADEGTKIAFFESLDRTDNSVIELPYPIYKITKLFGSGDSGASGIDITSNVVTKMKYDTLTNFEKRRMIYYEPGSNLIRGLGFLYQADAEPAVVNAMGIHLDGGKTYVVRQLLFRVEYVPLVPDIVKGRAAKDALETFKHNHIWITNQPDNIVAANSFGNYMENTADRVGQPLLRFFKSYPRNGNFNLPPLGAYLNPGWYLSTRSYTVLRQNIVGEFIFSKNFNIIGGPISLDSEPRYYEISAQGNTLVRREYMSEYCVIGNPVVGGESGTFKEEAASFMKVFDNAAQDIKISTASVVTRNANKVWIRQFLLPCDAKAFGNSLLFSFSFKDNFSAGTRMENEESRDSVIDVSYTEDFGDNINSGKVEYMSVYYGATPYIDSVVMPIRVAARLPQVSMTNNRPWVVENILYKKDNKEVPVLNFQIHMVANDKRFVIGAALAENNPLIVKTAAKTLQVRYLTQKVKKHRNGNIASISVPSGLTFSVLNDRIIQVNGTFDQQYAGYAITDSNGDLYVAFNDQSFTPIEFSFVKTIYEN